MLKLKFWEDEDKKKMDINIIAAGLTILKLKGH